MSTNPTPPTAFPLNLTVALGAPAPVPGQRWASIYAGEAELFTDLVYDNPPNNPAERNIVLMFGRKMRVLLERD
jgi:hypothetical protein